MTRPRCARCAGPLFDELDGRARHYARVCLVCGCVTAYHNGDGTISPGSRAPTRRERDARQRFAWAYVDGHVPIT